VLAAAAAAAVFSPPPAAARVLPGPAPTSTADTARHARQQPHPAPGTPLLPSLSLLSLRARAATENAIFTKTTTTTGHTTNETATSRLRRGGVRGRARCIVAPSSDRRSNRIRAAGTLFARARHRTGDGRPRVRPLVERAPAAVASDEKTNTNLQRLFRRHFRSVLLT